MLDNLENKIKKEIDSGRVKPYGPYFFLLKKIIFWFLVLVFLVLAGMSLSVLILIARYGDWDIYSFLDLSAPIFFLKAFPYFWLLGVVAFLFASFYRLRRADGAYSHPFIYHGLAGFLVIIIFAGIFYFSGLGQKTEAWLAESEVYRQANYLRSSWDNPDKGLLAGNLEFLSGEVMLRDFNNELWLLLLPLNDFPGSHLLIDGERVKLIGKTAEGDNNFSVEQVRPWECGCSHCVNSQKSCQGCSGGACNSQASCGMSN